MNTSNRLNIDRIAFIGRTYAEYMKIFDLTEDILRQGPVLDCPAGAASFAAEAHEIGINVTSCDILFNSKVEALIEKGMKDINHIYDNVKQAHHLYAWIYYKNIDNLISYRKSALDKFAREQFNDET